MSAGRCWLIESRAHASPAYWRGKMYGHAWSGSVDEAIRFVRKQDAAEVIRGLDLKLCDAVEHEWVPPVAPPAPSWREG